MSGEGSAINDAERAHRELAEKILKPHSAVMEHSQVLPDLMDVPAPPKPTVQNLTRYMDDLEIRKDLKLGITTTIYKNELAHIGNNGGKKSDVIIRDASLQTDQHRLKKSDDISESWQIAAASVTRGALKLIEMSRLVSEKDRASHTPDKATEQTIEIFQRYQEALSDDNISPKQMESIVKKMNYEVIKVLKQNGLNVNGVKFSKLSDDDMAKTLAKARDYCNLERENHPTIVTITSDISPDTGHKIQKVRAAIPSTPCKENEYFGPTMKQQAWHKSLSKSKKPTDKIAAAFIDVYKDKMQDGQHIISAQDREIPGRKNSYVENHSYIIDGKHEQDLGFVVGRSATDVFGCGTSATDKPFAEELTRRNFAHADQMMGSGEYIGFNSNIGFIARWTPTSQRSEQRISDMAGKVLGDQFISAPLSVSNNKTDHLQHAANVILDIDPTLEPKAQRLSKWQRIKKAFCKSGKDRTPTGIDEAALQDTYAVSAVVCKRDLDPFEMKKIAQITEASGHNTTLAAGNGSSRGTFGTKGGNVFGSGWKARLFGLKLKAGAILDIEAQVKNSINHVVKLEYENPHGIKSRIKDIISRKGKKEQNINHDR